MFLELLGSSVDVTYNLDINIKSIEQTIISLHAGRLTNKLNTNSVLGSFGGSIFQGYIKKGEDAVNDVIGNGFMGEFLRGAFLQKAY